MTTIVLVRKNNEVVVAGDGQVSMGNTVVKSTASKVRRIEKRDVVAGFAGSTADALTIFDTSSVQTDIDIEQLCMYTITNIWLEKEKYLEKQKKPASMLK